MEKKSDIVRRLVAAGDFRKALNIAKDFRLGITRKQHDQLRLAYECMVHPEFYRQIGTDIPGAIEDGVSLLKAMYG